MEQPERHRLPNDRDALTHHVCIKYAAEAADGQSTQITEKNAYITVGFFPDTQRVGEVFIKVDKSGGLESVMADLACIFMSLGLQHGIPLDSFVSKLIGVRVEFSGDGWTSNPEIPKCASLVDYLGKWLALKWIRAD